MLVLVGIVFFLIFLSFIPVCICVEYSDKGFFACLKIFFFKIKLTGNKKGEKTAHKVSDKKHNEKKPGDRNMLLNMITPAFNALGRLIKWIVVKKLIMDINIGGKDAFSTAMMYGGTAAGIGMLFPFLDSGLKIKKKSVSVNADFESESVSVYLLADIRIFFGQLVAIAICFIYKYMKKIRIKERKLKNG